MLRPRPVRDSESTASPAESHPPKEIPVAATTNATRLTLAIQPWGVVYVNGKETGYHRPLKELLLAPGTYVVEVRNGGYEPYRQSFKLRNGIAAKVTHRFSDASKAATKDTEAKPLCCAVENNPPAERRVAAVVAVVLSRDGKRSLASG